MFKGLNKDVHYCHGCFYLGKTGERKRRGPSEKRKGGGMVVESLAHGCLLGGIRSI